MTRLPLLLAALFLALAPALVRAQTPPAPPLTPDQAKAALSVLNDPKKRAEFTATLDAIARAQPSPAATSAPPLVAASGAGSQATPDQTTPDHAAASPAQALPLQPDSLGADLIVSMSGFLDQISHQAKQAVETAYSIPLLWGWTVVMATDPRGRELLADVAWRLAVVLICALAVEYSLRHVVARPLRALEQHAPHNHNHNHTTSEEELPDETPDSEPATVARAEAGEIEAPHRGSLRLSAWTLLRRVPFVLARLVLELIPVGAFLVAGHVITRTDVGGNSLTQLVLLAVVDAYVLGRILLVVARILLSPAASRLRLFALPNGMAAYGMQWARRLIIIGVFGYGTAEVGLLLGMSNAAHDAVLKAVGFVLHACLIIIVLQKRRTVAAWLRTAEADSGAARLWNGLAVSWHWIALFFIVTGWLAWAFEVPHGFTRVLNSFVVTALLLLGARLTLIVLLGSIDRGLRPTRTADSEGESLQVRLSVYYPVITLGIRTAVYLLTVLGLLQLYGFGAFSWLFTTALGERMLSATGTLAVTLALALLVWEMVNAAIHRHLRQLQNEAQLARSARLRTLLPLVRTTLLITIVIVAGLMVLSEIGVNIAPLLAGAGIVGVAIGFGSQKLVQDLINGIFLLLENAMQVGDWVTVSGLSGTVEALSVRTIRLRAGDGSVHIIPFSAVSSVTNTNRGIGNAAISVAVAFDENPDRVFDILKSIAADMRQETDYASKMLSDLQLWGVDKVDGASMTIAGQIVCTDSGRWPVQREFNRRLRLCFQKEGVRMFNPTEMIAVEHALPGAPEPRALEGPGRMQLVKERG